MPNRLARETSPYLQQHAGNPVDWHAWGEEALARAREEDKPILLSVGYSACHWCHVMAHESFEDPAAPIAAALRSLKASFDSRYGGFGGAPKFPHPADLEFCLRRSSAAGDGAAERVATYTLERMALGGIYDQIGGGFSRYSVDAQWQIPHFEKMLYDNGPLLRLYP